MDFIIVAGILIVLITAVIHSKKHLKGSGCCGGGSNIIRDKKTLSEPKLGEKTLVIEDMHCENCEIRIENALNRIDGILCKASWKKKSATVSYSKEISYETLKETVEKLGYTVTAVK